MKLSKLLKVLKPSEIFGPTGAEIKEIIFDSRKVKRGSLFVAIKGSKFDGHDFIPEAVERGAAAIVCEKSAVNSQQSTVCLVRVKNSRRALGLLASSWYGFPLKRLRVIGITGTDGKTTTTHLVNAILKAAGKKAGLVSTVAAKIGGEEYETGLHTTTPDPLELQGFLAKMVKARCKYAVLEVTSHGLDQERVAGIDFAAAVVTNVTPEHLDYHGTYRNYLATKAKLFKGVEVAVLNRDDGSYKYLDTMIQGYKDTSRSDGDMKRSEGLTRIVTYGIEKKADFTSQTFKFKTSLPGAYNQYNCLAAIAVASSLGIDGKSIRKAIASFKGVEGRMERVDSGKRGIKVVIDFAHTPNALEQVLGLTSNLKPKASNLICVFGCAGERDKGKRRKMGEIAAGYANFTVITAEDPRTEDVNDISEQIAKGCQEGGAVEKISKIKNQRSKIRDNGGKKAYFLREPDRQRAIDLAVQLAQRGDWVVICGKGHERSMCFGTKEYPWSEHEAVKKANIKMQKSK